MLIRKSQTNVFCFVLHLDYDPVKAPVEAGYRSFAGRPSSQGVRALTFFFAHFLLLIQGSCTAAMMAEAATKTVSLRTLQ